MSEEEKETKEQEEEVVKEVKDEDERAKEVVAKKQVNIDGWVPKTNIGRKVQDGKITDINELLDKGINILEPEIIETLLPEMKTELLLIGQSKGKFGGGQRRIFRQTQKKTKEGNKPKFATIAVIGNKNGFVGVGYGKSRETVPAREKALRNAKLNLIKISRGCGSWQCTCKDAHSIPFAVKGKCGSVQLKLMPAPKGTGLCIEPECAKILELAGIKDIWSKTKGKTKSKAKLIMACEKALLSLIHTKKQEEHNKTLNLVEGKDKGE